MLLVQMFNLVAVSVDILFWCCLWVYCASRVSSWNHERLNWSCVVWIQCWSLWSLLTGLHRGTLVQERCLDMYYVYGDASNGLDGRRVCPHCPASGVCVSSVTFDSAVEVAKGYFFSPVDCLWCCYLCSRSRWRHFVGWGILTEDHHCLV